MSGLVALAALTFTGMVGGLILANNGHEVPQWLSSTITGLGTNFGIVVLVVYQRSGSGNGAGYADGGVQRGGLAGTSVSTSTGVKAG